MTETTEKKTILGWLREHSILLLVIVGALLMVLTLKTQTVLVTDTKEQKYTIEFNYSLFGYCVSANPMTDEAKPIAAAYMLVPGSIDNTVSKAAEWISENADSGVEIYVNGYPRNKTKLTEHLCEVLKEQGIDAKEFEKKE